MAGLVWAGTGHRPDKLGGYGPSAFAALVRIARSWIEGAQPRGVISGMALGWDQALAQAAVDAGVPFVAAVPFSGQESAWPAGSQEQYRRLIARAKRVAVVCDGGYAAWKMQRRNEWMVDKADAIVAVWNGTPGGTKNCLVYAAAKQRPVENLWDRLGVVDRVGLEPTTSRLRVDRSTN
jgi:uncharacterized phage-like protein YoqJ